MDNLSFLVYVKDILSFSYLRFYFWTTPNSIYRGENHEQKIREPSGLLA